MARYGQITYYTSQIYPVVVTEGVAATASMAFDDFNYDFGLPDEIASSGDFIAGAIFAALFSYTNAVPEAIDTVTDFLSGTIVNALVTYSNYAAEGLDLPQPRVIAGTVVVALVSYNNYPTEGCNVVADFIAGNLI